MSTMRVSLDDHIFEGNKAPAAQPIKQSNVQPVISKQSMTALPKKRFQIGKVTAVVLSLAFVFGVIRFALPFFSSSSVLGVTNQEEGVFSARPEIKKDENGKTNVLLVGIDTREEGQIELNTDTIILASYDVETNRLAMISFPRDLAVTYPDSDVVGRINATYAYAENKKKNSGLEALQKLITQLSGQEIHYAAMIDLKGFTDVIDVIGGVDVYLDYDLSGLYPTANFGYERVNFTKGWNHFSGQQALKFSRLRKDMIPTSEEGDFARSIRQQKVIQSVVDKVSKTETLLNAKKIMELLGVVSKNIKTTKFGIDEIQTALLILKEKGRPTTHSSVLDLYAGGSAYRLIDVVNANPYLLGPRLGMGNWGEIQGYIKEYFLEPALVTTDKKIAVYHVTDSARKQELLAKMTKRHYFVKIVDAGTLSMPEATQLSGKVYAVGGKKYESTAKFLAKEYGLDYSIDLPTSISADSMTAIVIVR